MVCTPTPGSHHTPGPWRIVGTRDADEYAIYGGSDPGGPVCHIALTFGYGDADEANARLIAAAPTLLAAVEAAISAFEAEVPIGNETIAMLKAACNLATKGHHDGLYANAR